MERPTWVDEAARAAFPPESGTERRTGLARAIASNLLFAFQGWPGSVAEREQWARHFREEPHDTPAAVQARREDVRARVLLALRDRFASFQRKRYALLALANLHALGVGDAHELKRHDRVWWVLPSLRDYLRDALLGLEGLGGDHAFARSCELESAISQADPPQMPTAHGDAAEADEDDGSPDPSASTARAFREHAAQWNAALDGYRRKVAALCWTPAAHRRTAFGELLAVDLGFGLPPHEGLDPANRLLGAAVCAALRGVGESDPEYTMLLTVGLTRDRVRLFQSLRALLDRDGREEPQQVAAVVALVALAHLQDRDGPAPDPGVFQVGPRWIAERALNEGRVPARAASLASRFLNDELIGPELVSAGRALLASAEVRRAAEAPGETPVLAAAVPPPPPAMSPLPVAPAVPLPEAEPAAVVRQEPIANSAEGRALKALRGAGGGFVAGIGGEIKRRLVGKGHRIESAQDARKRDSSVSPDAKGYRLLEP